MSEKNKMTVVWLTLIVAFVAWVLPSQYYTLNPQVAEKYRLGSVLVALIAAIVTFWFTENRHKFLHLLKDAKVEFLKVVWPTKSEATTYLITVVVFSIVVALYCYLIDLVVEWVLYSGILG